MKMREITEITEKFVKFLLGTDVENIRYPEDGEDSFDEESFFRGDFLAYEINFEGNVEDWEVDVNHLVNLAKVRFSDLRYILSSYVDFDKTWNVDVSGTIFKKRFKGESEFETITKACDWIMRIENL
jgi:hypothetical protein